MSSGTEATSTAVRLARGHTGRDRIVIFHGNFHGVTDALLAAGGSGVATLGLPGTAGVPDAAVANTMVVPYNVVPELDEQVAAVLVEPVAANMGVVAPAPGFLAGLRAECDRVGALLVFDEVITGFRLGPGGAQAKYDIDADLTTFGKVIGGGLPIGAVGGRRAVMETLSPLGPVFQSGTLSGNPLATAAGRTALELLTGDVYIELMARTRHLAAQLGEVCRAAGLAVQVPVVGTLAGLFFGDGDAPTNFAEAKQTNERAFAAFFHATLREGVALALARTRRCSSGGVTPTRARRDRRCGRARREATVAQLGVTLPVARLALALRFWGQFITLRFWMSLSPVVVLLAGQRHHPPDPSNDKRHRRQWRPGDAQGPLRRGGVLLYRRRRVRRRSRAGPTASWSPSSTGRGRWSSTGHARRIECSQLAEIGQCVVLADLLGDVVLWFAIVPFEQSQNVTLPGIAKL